MAPCTLYKRNGDHVDYCGRGPCHEKLLAQGYAVWWPEFEERKQRGEW